jgi:protein-disulfide isomerase/uncharacterized membrane protein
MIEQSHPKTTEQPERKTSPESHHEISRLDRALPLICLVLCLVGLGAAAELTRIHVEVHTNPGYRSFCAYSERVNCDTVAESSYSLFASVPVSVWGMIGYVAMAGFSLAIWRKKKKGDKGAPLTGGLLGLTSFSFLVSVALAYISFTKIQSICVLCFTTYGINAALLAMTGWMVIRAGGVKEVIKRSVSYFLVERPGLSAALLIPALIGVGGLLWGYPRYWVAEPDHVGPKGLPVGMDSDENPWIGAKKPELTIVEYSDYQCPFCRLRHREVRSIVEENPKRVRLVHRHYPLDQTCHPIVKRRFHDHACLMAEMAVCAGRQGKFWQANDLLFFWPKNDLPPTAAALAKKAGLSLEKLKKCLQDSTVAAHIQRDIRDGMKLGIRGTPTFVIEGKKYVGRVPKSVVTEKLGKEKQPEARQPSERSGHRDDDETK